MPDYKKVLQDLISIVGPGFEGYSEAAAGYRNDQRQQERMEMERQRLDSALQTADLQRTIAQQGMGITQQQQDYFTTPSLNYTRALGQGEMGPPPLEQISPQQQQHILRQEALTQSNIDRGRAENQFQQTQGFLQEERPGFYPPGIETGAEARALGIGPVSPETDGGLDLETLFKSEISLARLRTNTFEKSYDTTMDGLKRMTLQSVAANPELGQATIDEIMNHLNPSYWVKYADPGIEQRAKDAANADADNAVAQARLMLDAMRGIDRSAALTGSPIEPIVDDRGLEEIWAGSRDKEVGRGTLLGKEGTSRWRGRSAYDPGEKKKSKRVLPEITPFQGK